MRILEWLPRRWLSLLAWGAMAWLPVCSGTDARRPGATSRTPTAEPFVVVLGTAQDAGYPQSACRRDCCAEAWRDPSRRRLVSSLAIVDPLSRERWIIDATPDFREQLHRLDAIAPFATSPSRAELDGFLLTHAHIGHYTGLQQLGREAIGERETAVYAMPRLSEFLRTNGPWSLLVSAGHIALRPLVADEPVRLNERLTVTPILVPHRDEYSETVGFRIAGPGRTVLFIPDIDKWEKWDRNVEDEIARVEVAYLDGTFYSAGELPGRDLSEIPHPLIEESMARFETLPPAVRARVRFLHLNHTNPALRADSDAARELTRRGFTVAVEGEVVELGK